MSEDWFWEGNVVESLCKTLIREGWSIQHVADTATRESGIDVLARRDDRLLVVEVKGYPSAFYQRGPKAGQVKPTRAAAQARHWFSRVFVTAILRQYQHPSDTVAIALPDFPVYLSLIERTQHALDKLGIFVLIVEQSGMVRTISPANGSPL